MGRPAPARASCSSRRSSTILASSRSIYRSRSRCPALGLAEPRWDLSAPVRDARSTRRRQSSTRRFANFRVLQRGRARSRSQPSGSSVWTTQARTRIQTGIGCSCRSGTGSAMIRSRSGLTTRCHSFWELVLQVSLQQSWIPAVRQPNRCMLLVAAEEYPSCSLLALDGGGGVR